jgi:hypothetical protein
MSLSRLVRVGLGVALALAAVPVQAADAGKVCLQSARIFTWEAPDQHTLIVTDREKKTYKVTMAGTCLGLDNTKLAIAFITQSGISCVGQGDKVRYRDEVLGPQQCFVSKVEAYTPPPKPDKTD